MKHKYKNNQQQTTTKGERERERIKQTLFESENLKVKHTWKNTNIHY